MLTTIKVYYGHGQIVSYTKLYQWKRNRVIITFITEDAPLKHPQKKTLFGIEGLVNLPDDFDEPLVRRF